MDNLLGCCPCGGTDRVVVNLYRGETYVFQLLVRTHHFHNLMDQLLVSCGFGVHKGGLTEAQTYANTFPRHGLSSRLYHFNIQQVAEMLSIPPGFNLIGFGLSFPTVVQVGVCELEPKKAWASLQPPFRMHRRCRVGVGGQAPFRMHRRCRVGTVA